MECYEGFERCSIASDRIVKPKFSRLICWGESLFQEVTHIPVPFGTFEDEFPFPKVGYVSSLEGTIIMQTSLGV